MSRTIYYDYMGCEFDPPLEIDEVPKTHFDEIKAMSVEELARFITDDLCELFCGAPSVCDGNCEGKMLSWLKQEVDNG